MRLREEFAAARTVWKLMTLYQKFEQAVILMLTGLISIVVALAVWNLVIKVATSIVSTGFDPTDYAVFQELFGMIFTVIIALEFKRSLLVVVADRRFGIVQVRTVILIALLAVVRKLMIVDLSAAEANQLLALSAAIVALGSVFWLIRDQDRRDQSGQKL